MTYYKLITIMCVIVVIIIIIIDSYQYGDEKATNETVMNLDSSICVYGVDFDDSKTNDVVVVGLCAIVRCNRFERLLFSFCS